MSEQDKSQDMTEDLFDFPQVEGFSPEFIEAARLQTEATQDHGPEASASFDEQMSEDELAYDDFEDEFADNFADLMGDPVPQEEVEVGESGPTEEPVPAVAEKGQGFDLRFVWGALALLFATNLLWAWTWHSSEGRLRGEMDQRFQGYLAQQRSQLDEVVTALAPAQETAELPSAPRPLPQELVQPDPSVATLEEIKRDLFHMRHDTARAKAWRLIATVDGLPKERRASAEASARLLIAESYELEGTDTQENEG